MKNLILAVGLSLMGLTSFAEVRTPSAAAQCVHQDGYGTYRGEGTNAHMARSQASEQCFHRQLDLFEETRGRLPTDEEAEPLLFSCLNICP